MEENVSYKKLFVWKNSYELRRMVYQISLRFPKTEIRRISQMRDAARSVKQNIQEGYSKSLPSYINHLNIARGSLLELRGDIEDCFDDELISEQEFRKLLELVNKTQYLFKKLIESLNQKKIKEAAHKTL